MATTETAVRMAQSPKRVRVMLDGRFVADASPLLVWEKPYYPTYFFPRDTVHEAALGTNRAWPQVYVI